MVQDAFRQQRILRTKKNKANIIEGFNGLNLADYFQTRCHVPVAVENDANCAAAAECLLGNGAAQQRNLAVRLSERASAEVWFTKIDRCRF